MKCNSSIKISLPKYPKLIIDTLEKEGFEAYIVGGCVRDAILKKAPSDYDITTNAKPEEIKRLFKRTIDTGIKHGTVAVLFYENDEPITYEVTTYRIDGEYKDSRHPDSVVFVDDLKEDLRRRDFTINAMAYNDKRGLVDEFGGIDDLKKKVVRAVGNPTERFKEDALRLLRAIRFSAKLGFKLEKETKNAIPILAYSIENVSKERIQVELTKTLVSANPDYIDEIYNLDLVRYISEDLANVKRGKIKPFLPVHIAYACFLYNEEIETINRILKEIKFDNSNISKITMLITARQYYNKILESKKQNDKTSYEVYVKELVNYLKYDLVYDFITLLKINDNNKGAVRDLKQIIDKFRKTNTPIFINDLRIDGNDITRIGYKGVEVGIVLSKLLELVHRDYSYNDKVKLIEIATRVYDTYKSINK